MHSSAVLVLLAGLRPCVPIFDGKQACLGLKVSYEYCFTTKATGNCTETLHKYRQISDRAAQNKLPELNSVMEMSKFA